MKTFRQFQEDAASEYESGKQQYERSGKVLRQQQREKASEEAKRRKRKSKTFTREMKQKDKSLKQSSVEKFEVQQQQVAKRKARKEQKRREQAERTKKIAGRVKTAIKGTLQASKGVVKFVRNRMARRNDQQTGQRRNSRS